MCSDAERARDLGAGLAAHQPIVAARELALARGRKLLVQELGDGEAEHAVADELQALVVAALALAPAHARVRERDLQDCLVLEAVAQRLLEVLVFARTQHGITRLAHPRRARKGMWLAGRENRCFREVQQSASGRA